MLCLGHPNDVKVAKSEFMRKFPCDDIGEFIVYVGCKIVKENGTMKFTQPVLLQSYQDEFLLPKAEYETPATPGQVLSKVQPGNAVSSTKQRKFRSGVGKLLHMMRWSRPDIWNAVRECSRRMTECDNNNMK